MDVAGRFPKAILLRGSQNTVAGINGYLERVAIFHFAGHAVRTANGTGLVLGPAVRDGDLFSTITGSSLPSKRSETLRLAVLSACASEGPFDPNDLAEEGSLATAFLRMSVPQVVASTWNVDSFATERLMSVFYQALLSGKGASESLQEAMLKLKANPSTEHPYYWASFTNFGSAYPIQEE
jgi:CHAT domain-containing protein